jgi:hypothetical protein
LSMSQAIWKVEHQMTLWYFGKGLSRVAMIEVCLRLFESIASGS